MLNLEFGSCRHRSSVIMKHFMLKGMLKMLKI